jgi:hypothetical protein
MAESIRRTGAERDPSGSAPAWAPQANHSGEGGRSPDAGRTSRGTGNPLEHANACTWGGTAFGHHRSHLESTRAAAASCANVQASKDPRFVEKLHDVVGLYLNPTERAVVFSVDAKTQIQALDRTQPGLPLKKGRAGPMTHDYKRHGTTTLFTALNVASGEIVANCSARKRHQEFLRFTKKVVAQVEPSLDVHFILDNSSVHKGSAQVAREEPSGALPLHPDQRVVAQPARAILR